jgi:hypothetical protein
MLTDPRSRTAVRVAERFADGDATADALTTAHLAAAAAARQHRRRVEGREADYDDPYRYSGTQACQLATGADQDEVLWAWSDVAETLLDAGSKWHAELAAAADLIRCCFGNPFRPAVLDPDWRTSTVVALATGVYSDRAWDRLPVLADALEDAGCTDPEVIGHCRGPGPHARGCWVVDLILGKT